FFNAVNMYSIFTDIYPTVEAARRQFGGELTSMEKQMELARQMANNFRLLLQQSRSGSTLTDAEQELYRQMLPDPSEGVSHMWDRIHNAWNTFATMYGRQTRAILRNYGVTFDSTAANAPLRRRALERVREE